MSVSFGGSSLGRQLWARRHLVWVGRSMSLAARQVQPLCAVPTSRIHHTPRQQQEQQPQQPQEQPCRQPAMHAVPTSTSTRALDSAIRDYCAEGLVDDAQQLVWAALQSGQPPPSSYGFVHLFRALAKEFNVAEKQQQARRLLDAMIKHGVAPSPQIYVQLILGLVYHTHAPPQLHASITPLIHGFLRAEEKRHFKRIDAKMAKMLRAMTAAGRPDAIVATMTLATHANAPIANETWHLALYGCLRRGNLSHAEQLLDFIAIPTNDAYHMMLGAYLGRRVMLDGSFCTNHARRTPKNAPIHLDRAIATLETMIASGSTPSHHVYAALLDAYTHHAPEKEIGVMQRLWQAWLVSQTHHADEDSHWDDWLPPVLANYMEKGAMEAVDQVYWDLRQHDLPIGSKMLPIFDDAIIHGAEKQHLLSSLAMYYDLVANGHCNVRASSALLRATIQRGHLDLSRQLLQSVHDETGRPLPLSLYALVIRAHVDQRQFNDATQLYEKILTFPSSPSNARALLFVQCSMVQQALAMHQWDVATQILDQWVAARHDAPKKEKNVLLDTERIMTNTLIAGLATQQQPKQIALLHACLDKMQVDPVTSHASTASLWVRALLQMGHLDKAADALDRAIKAHGQARLVPATHDVLDHAALKGNKQLCEALFHNLGHDKKALHAMLVCYGQAKDNINLKRVYNQCQQHDVALEPALYDKVQQWLAQ
ncbi:hypothetical protein BC940DRAFT_337225 [Gongronella butleri]|nr:hypothetical protein BC940DRAFT_337225 [Gongronella butleri]